MGEIADMMLDGTLDAMTGEYLGEGYGVPRTANKSLPWEREDGESPGAYIRPVMDILTGRGIRETGKRFEVINAYMALRDCKNVTLTCKLIRSTPEEKGKFSVFLNDNGYKRLRHKKV